MTLDAASPNAPYIVERVPEEDEDLLRFLVDSQIVPEHRIEVLEATSYLGVITVAAEKGKVSIGYNVAQQILVCPAESSETMQADTQDPQESETSG